MASISSPSQNGKAYTYVDHSYDVIVAVSYTHLTLPTNREV